MKNIIILLFCFSLSCCCKNRQDVTATIDRYKEVNRILQKYSSRFKSYKKEFNKAGTSYFLISVNQQEFSEILNRAKITDLEIVKKLWTDALLVDEDNSLKIRDNGNIYFTVSNCLSKKKILVYDGGEPLGIGQTDDTTTEPIEKDWILMTYR